MDLSVYPLLYHCGFWAGLCFIVSTITGNVSQVDKLWSLTPALYAWQIVFSSDTLQMRMVLMAVLATIWAARLTYNFSRRGGYTWPPWEGEEDYRWPILRKTKPLNNPLVWMAFNLGFISIYQHFLLLLIVLPQFIAASAPGKDMITTLDLVLALAFLLLVLVEYIADQQQYDFQTEKYRLKGTGLALYGEYKVGYLRTGLWSISRHPNYFAEQSIWVVYYLFSGAAGAGWLNASVIGPVLLILLFQGSVFIHNI
mmetsp:Transcript_21653/g.34940  ORF Transcript_21653/g.34940 Transcript_21653/m.34940 type:complete len:255 (+) Transcript_21653:99-863(+)